MTWTTKAACLSSGFQRCSIRYGAPRTGRRIGKAHENSVGPVPRAGCLSAKSSWLKRLHHHQLLPRTQLLHTFPPLPTLTPSSFCIIINTTSHHLLNLATDYTASPTPILPPQTKPLHRRPALLLWPPLFSPRHRFRARPHLLLPALLLLRPASLAVGTTSTLPNSKTVVHSFVAPKPIGYSSLL